MNHSANQPQGNQAPDHAPAYVSVVNELPEDLYDAMREFVRSHPQWDQYRLIQAFLFQHGSTDRAVSRHYLDGLFRREGSKPRPQATTPRLEAKPAPSVVVKLPQAPRNPQGQSWSAAA